MRIAQKLPIVIVSLVLASATLSGLVAYSRSSSQLVDASKARLSGLAEARRGQVVAMFEAFGQDAEILAANAAVVSAVKSMADAVLAMDRSTHQTAKTVRETYIDRNPNPAGKRYLLSGSMDPTEWGMAHTDYHPTFRKILERRGLGDILLVNSVGRVVYTTAKNTDLLEDMTSPQFKATPPGRLFEQLFKQHKPGQVLFTDFTNYAPAGTPSAFVASPIIDTGDEFVGVLMLELPVTRLDALLNDPSGLGQTGEAILVGADGKRVNNSRFEGRGKALVDTVDNDAVTAGLAGASGIVSTKDAAGKSLLAAHSPIAFSGAKWTLVIEAEVAEILEPVAEMRTSLIIGGLVVLLVAGAAGLWFAGRISKPISAITASMNRLAEGDTSVAIPSSDGKDEIGEMARAVGVFRNNALEMSRMQGMQEEAKRQAEAERKDAINQVVDRFGASIASVVDGVTLTAEELKKTAGTMTELAEEVSRKASVVAQAAEHTTANVETVAAAAEELTASVGEISRHVAQASDIAGTAVQEANRANAMIAGLAEAADKIGEVVNLINEIAAQTNLLALNATIEAARAGEAGKGFSVVASEVKNLANQSARATDEIRQQITSVQSAARGAVDAIRGISGTIGQINTIAGTVADAVRNQGQATHDIARNIQEAAASTRDVSDNVGGVNQAADQAHSSAGKVMGAVQTLSSQAGTLRGGVDEFMTKVRS